MFLDSVPEWSGLFLERDEVGYLEISDADDRLHRPPPGWTLATIDECPEHSSQIFRYVKAEVDTKVRATMNIQVSGLLVAICASGCSILAMPLLQAILHPVGLA